MKKFPLVTIALMLSLATPYVAAAPLLPDLGDSSQSSLSSSDENKIGREILNSIRDSHEVVADREVNAYINRLGQALTSAAAVKGQSYRFFVVNDPTINAFAMPGGVIGVNSGLILTTQSEGELASVLAHEIAHVTQRHLARMRENQSKSQLWLLAAVLAGIAASRSGNSDAVLGALNAGTGLAMSTQLAYSRDFEREADRMGMQYLNGAGFDARDMPAFFERMQQANRLNDNKALAFIRTHPVTTERISEGQIRASSYPVKMRLNDTEYVLVREKLRLKTLTPDDSIRYYQAALADGRYLSQGAQYYGLSYAYLANRQLAEAQKALAEAKRLLPPSSFLLMLEAQCAEQGHRLAEALQLYQTGLKTYPNDRALLDADVNLLLQMGHRSQAITVIETALAQHPKDADFHRLAAQVYGEQSPMQYHAELGHAYYFEEQYEPALVQYRLASQAKGDQFYLRSSIEARIRELEKRQNDSKS